ncbi:MAG TPA: dTMP kinase [Gemmataceae bacterium]|jgi:dTMP kinase|nr:dTMP kinase [Gemmataceae bacterium]
MAQACFISVDGIDGTGKSTQCRLLADWLRRQGFSVTECADPGSTAIGDLIRPILLDRGRHMTPACEAFLFMASRAQLTAEIIRPALDANHIVICDRFLLANVAYQGHGAGLDPQHLWQMGRLATGGLEPHLTLVLDLPIEMARARRQGPADRLESRDAAYHARVRDGFLREAQRQPGRIRVIDARAGIEEVHQWICQEVAGVVATDSRA